MKFRTLTAVCLATVIILGTAIAALPQRVYRAASDFWGSRYQVSPAASAANTVPLPPQKDHDAAAQLRHWNAIAINASGLDHTPVAPGEHRVFGEQVGPVRAARAIAIVHIAMFEAVNAIDRSCKSYVGITPAQPVSSMNCAIAQAAHDTLCAVFPSQTPSFDQLLADENAQHVVLWPLTDHLGTIRDLATNNHGSAANTPPWLHVCKANPGWTPTCQKLYEDYLFMYKLN